MRKITFKTGLNQKSVNFFEDHNDTCIFDHKYHIDAGNLFSI